MIARVAALAAVAVGLLGAWTASASADVPHVRHVFIVVLENEDAAATFGEGTEIPYLSKTMTSKGAFLPNYYATGHLSLDNYISMVSGQAPNRTTQVDCPIYTDFVPGTASSDGQFVGTGCVYPPGVQNIATQLEGSGYRWRGYMQDMASSAPAEPSACRHPPLNSPDRTQRARPTDQYAARHNPFVYFHSIIDFPTCQANDVDLSRLGQDLRSKSTTPDYAFISPDLCNDGHDTPCVDGGPGGMAQANEFLADLIPRIMSSPAYGDRGLIIVTFDEAEDEASACCGEQSGPNTSMPGLAGPGGGRVGAVMVSNCIRPGTVSDVPYNHYSLLRSIERNFGLPYLGYAGLAGLRPFGEDVLNRSGCAVPHPCRSKRKQKRKKCKRGGKHNKQRRR